MAKKAQAKETPSLLFEPIGDRVIIKRDDPTTVSPGGIVIAEAVAERPQTGTVVAVGPGLLQNGTRVPLQVKVGDRVTFSAYAEVLKLNDIEFNVLHEQDVYTIIR